MTKLRLKSLGSENWEIESTICALNAALGEAKKLLACNQLSVSLRVHLSTLKSINKRPSSLAAGRFYAMDQAVIPKASPGGISIGGGLIVGGNLASLGINNNKTIS